MVQCSDLTIVDWLLVGGKFTNELGTGTCRLLAMERVAALGQQVLLPVLQDG